MPRDFDRRPRTSRPRRRSRTGDGGIVALIVVGAVVLAVGGAAAAFVLMRHPAILPDVPLPAVGPPIIGLPVIAPRPPLPAGWFEYTHPEGVYSVYLPQGSVKTAHGDIPRSLRQPVPVGQILMDTKTFEGTAVQVFGHVEVVVYRPEVVAETKPALEKHGSGDPNAVRTPVAWRGQPAVEFSGEMYKCGYFARQMWVGNWHYYVQLTHQPDKPPPTPEQRAAFFESFVPRN